jgi:hypothetical protein
MDSVVCNTARHRLFKIIAERVTMGLASKKRAERYPLSFRVTRRLVEAIDAAAVESGRTRSQQAEFWLERAVFARYSLQDSLSNHFGYQGAAVIEMLSLLMREPRDWMDDPQAFAETRAQINMILDAVAPTPASEAATEFRTDIRDFFSAVFHASPGSHWHRTSLMLRERLGPAVVARIVRWLEKQP